jgi:hypothetical protein
MKVSLTSMFAGLGLFAVLLTGSAQTKGSDVAMIDPPSRISTPLEEFVRVEFQGPIRQAKEMFPGRTVWQITVNGQTYELNLGNDKTHTLKDGMIVRVTGKLVHEERPQWMQTLEYPSRHWASRHVWTVAAETLETVSAKTPPTFARATVRGKLKLKAQLGYPQQAVQLVTADGQQIALDLGVMTGLGLLKVEALDGKVIDLEGDITGFLLVTTMCVPEHDELPILRVQKVTQAPVAG